MYTHTHTHTYVMHFNFIKFHMCSWSIYDFFIHVHLVLQLFITSDIYGVQLVFNTIAIMLAIKNGFTIIKLIYMYLYKLVYIK